MNEDSFVVVTNYESWGNLASIGYKMLPSIKKTLKRKEADASPTKAKGRQGQEHIYLIHVHGSIYKIGRSGNPQQRLQALQTSNPYPLSLVHTFEADQVDRAEMKLHEWLSGTRQEGEWFELTPTQRDTICRITAYRSGSFWVADQ